jgi:hypothetical protein
MPQEIALGDSLKLMQGATGVQRRLLIAKVPATASASLIGRTLIEAGALTVAGIYRCLIPISGLASSLEVFLTAAWSGGTVSSDLDTLYFVGDTVDDTTWRKKTAGSGDGSLTTATPQSPTIATLKGEQYAVLDITLTGTSSVTFSVAEYNGL